MVCQTYLDDLQAKADNGKQSVSDAVNKAAVKDLEKVNNAHSSLDNGVIRAMLTTLL